MTEWGRRSFLAGAGALLPIAAGSTASATGAVPDALPAATVRPGDPRYADLVRGVNERWVGTPRYVRVANSAEQVRQAVQEAVNAGQRITVRGGGHCFEDFVFGAGVQVVLDVSAMDSVGYDPAHKAISVGAGATLFTLYQTLYTALGVTIPGGPCGTVGVGGHITGGGYGLLSRSLGLTVDHLHGVEMVVVDAAGRARTVVATREPGDPNRDLWWACTGGGGGNFGVVTRFLFASLPRPPAELLTHSTGWSWEGLTEASFHRLVTNFGAWHEQHSAPGSPYNALFGLLDLHAKTPFQSEIALATQIDATVPGARRMLDEFLAAMRDGVGVPTTTDDEPVRKPWMRATYAMSGGTWDFRIKSKAAHLRARHTPDQLAATYEWLATKEFPHAAALVQMVSYGGAINAVAPDATAVAQRDSVIKVLYQTYWSDPADDAANLAWIRGLYHRTYAATGGVPVPNAVTDGGYVNYPDADLSDPAFNTSGVPWSTLYYKGNYPRLRRVKTAYDPRNVFRHRQSIEPA